MAGFRELVRELRRRRVFRAAGLYIVGAWASIEVASLVFPAIEVPESAIRYVWIAAILLFPVAIVFAWFFELSAEGLHRTAQSEHVSAAELSLRTWDYAILAALAIVVAAITWQVSGSIRGVAGSGRVVHLADLDPTSIAVLPFDNLSGDPEQQYFVSGMHGALIAGLSRIRDLRVTSKTSTMRYSGVTDPLPNIAAQLGVANLIEGSIYRVSDRVRITVQLIDASEDRHIWSQTFEDDIRDVLRMQREIAQAIASQVQVTIAPDAIGRDETKPVNPAAYEAYLKGQFHVERFTPQDMMMAGQYYQRAVDLDPDYALAWYGLSKLCGFQAQAGVITPEQAYEACLPPILRALQLDSRLPEAHMGYGAHMTWQRFNWEEGRKGFETAIELNPSYAEARMFYSHFLALMGEQEESTRQYQLALELDPFNPFVRGLYGAQRFMVGEYDECVRVLEEVMATTPGFGFGHNVLWKCYHELDQPDKSLRSAANYFRFTQGDETGALALEAAYEDGDFEAAARHAANALLEHSETAHVSPIAIGYLFDQAGDTERAIDMFRVAFATRDPDAPYMAVINKNPVIRRHPRFIELLRDMKHDYWADKYESGS